MNPKFLVGVSLITAIAVVSTTPALAVSQKVRAACERKAELVRPALRAGEKVAFIANCKVNASVSRRNR